MSVGRGGGRLASRPYRGAWMERNHPHLNLPPSRGKRYIGAFRGVLVVRLGGDDIDEAAGDVDQLSDFLVLGVGLDAGAGEGYLADFFLGD